jgi:glycolate oxidase FAD binding subunit
MTRPAHADSTARRRGGQRHRASFETRHVSTLAKPVLPDDVAHTIADAAARGLPIEIMGGGTKRTIGRPMNAALGLSTRLMSGVTMYEPTEMVMTARTGTPLSRIEQQLAAGGQMLAFEPINYAALGDGATGEATIGGVFAANLSGARRIQVGAARDHLLGAVGVNGRAEIFKSGGRVMKNVTGYDVARAMCGSWGTLAILTEVTFKVLPLPERTQTLVLLGLDDEIAVEALTRAMGTPYEVSGAAHIQAALVPRLGHESLRAQGRSVTLLRLEHVETSVMYRTQRLTEVLGVYGEVHTLPNDDSRMLWSELQRLSPLATSDAPVWRISTAPTHAPKIIAALQRYMDCRAFYDWSGGLVFAEVLPTADAGAADVRRVVASHGGHATLVRAAPAVRAIVDVFPPLDPIVAHITRRLKAAFDPAGVLNPGRMYAGF